MKIIKIKLHNFRGVLEQEMAFQPYTVLVGPNNAGKSTFIDAIRAFYEKDGFKFKPDNDFPFSSDVADQESWVELTFSLSDEEHESLKDSYKTDQKTLRVRKYFRTSSQTYKSGIIYGYNSDGNLDTNAFYGEKNVQAGKFGDIVYIPAVSKVDEHTKLSGPSALRDLVADVMTDVMTGEAYQQFGHAVSSFSTAVMAEKTKDSRSLTGFEQTLNQLLKPWNTVFKFQFQVPSPQDIVKQMVDWNLLDSSFDKPQGVQYFGSGFQRHFIYSLIQIGSQYVGKKESKKTKDFTPSMTFVLFEEPEAFLHPPQQDILARNLIAVSKKDDWQVLCSTHSSHFVSRNSDSIPAIVRVMRKDGKINVFQISAEDWDKIVDANQLLNAIVKKYPKLHKKLDADDEKPEMEAVKHFLWLNPDRSSLFFANVVLLVEGATETALINKLVGDGKIANSDCGFYALDCLGKYNIHRFMNLLNHLGIPYAVLHDDDNDNEEHVDINKLIQDSKHNTFTLSIQPLETDLEHFLGITPTPPQSSHRKPQHVLFQYSQGAISQENLDKFCELISSIFILHDKRKRQIEQN